MFVMSKNILLAGPGTGKTSKIKSLLMRLEPKKTLILSFTNATVDDLLGDLKDYGITKDQCMTLHKFSLKKNVADEKHVLLQNEKKIVERICKRIGIGYDKMCSFLEVTDFNLMLREFYDFARTNTCYLEDKLNHFDNIIIDEYQDFNPIEQEIIELILNYFSNIYILGDDDQCIYKFKDSNPERIISKHKADEYSNISHDHVCYRCPDKIVEAASKLIKLNSNRVQKEWRKSNKDGHIFINQMRNQEELNTNIIKTIQNNYDLDQNAKQFILSPNNTFLESLSEQLSKENIPHDFLGKYLYPNALIHLSWVLKLKFADNKYFNLIMLVDKGLSNRKVFYDMIARQYSDGKNISDLKSKFTSLLPNDVLEEKVDIDELLRREQFKPLHDLYSNIEDGNINYKLEKMFDQNNTNNEVENIRLMTIYKSKGLSADHVYVLGVNEGLIPRKCQSESELEYERRLFYVAMTRSKKNLYLYPIYNLPGKVLHSLNAGSFEYDHVTKMRRVKTSSFLNEIHHYAT